MWERGLKLSRMAIVPTFQVAPYVGAWIETREQGLPATASYVAPYVGAWIETRKALLLP